MRERTLIKQTMNCPIHTVKKGKKTSCKTWFELTFYLWLFLLWWVGTMQEEGCCPPVSSTHVMVGVKVPALNAKSKP